jgi:hypothetical protein
MAGKYKTIDVESRRQADRELNNKLKEFTEAPEIRTQKGKQKSEAIQASYNVLIAMNDLKYKGKPNDIIYVGETLPRKVDSNHIDQVNGFIRDFRNIVELTLDEYRCDEYDFENAEAQAKHTYAMLEYAKNNLKGDKKVKKAIKDWIEILQEKIETAFDKDSRQQKNYSQLNKEAFKNEAKDKPLNKIQDKIKEVNIEFEQIKKPKEKKRFGRKV